MQNTNEIIDEAYRLLEKNLHERNLDDLNKLLIIKNKIASLIPYAKKDLRIRELDADNIEKETILRLRGDKGKQTIDEIKAKARINRNIKEKECIDLEYIYISLYGLHQELADSIITTRLVMKM